MVRSSTYKDEQYQIYEMHNESGHVVTSGEDGDTEIIVSSIRPHAVVTANEEYARAYVDGVLVTVSSVVDSSPNTTVNFAAALNLGETVDIFFPSTTGHLTTNGSSGKLALPRLQSIQAWDVEEVTAPVLECGTEREEEIELAVNGKIVLGLNRHGNKALSDFIAANEGNSDGTPIYLLIDVVDSTVAIKTHDLLIEAEVESYDRVSRAVNTLQGIVTDTITFVFQPDVVTFAET